MSVVNSGDAIFSKVNNIQSEEIEPNKPVISTSLEKNNISPPDIYYIILDAYGRSDVLQTTYGIDNSVFLSQLQELGFYVAECSMSNYAQTELSLSSSLNLNYLQSHGNTFTPGKNNDALLISLIKI